MKRLMTRACLLTEVEALVDWGVRRREAGVNLLSSYLATHYKAAGGTREQVLQRMADIMPLVPLPDKNEVRRLYEMFAGRVLTDGLELPPADPRPKIRRGLFSDRDKAVWWAEDRFRAIGRSGDVHALPPPPWQ